MSDVWTVYLTLSEEPKFGMLTTELSESIGRDEATSEERHMKYIIQRLVSGTKQDEHALWEDDTTAYGESDALYVIRELREKNDNQVYRIVIVYSE